MYVHVTGSTAPAGFCITCWHISKHPKLRKGISPTHYKITDDPLSHAGLSYSMSFGFGVGDFLAAATLAWKISVALRSAKQTSESLKLLIFELEFTSQALNQAGNILENAGLQASAMNVMQLGLSRCQGELNKLNEILNKYGQVGGGGTSGGFGSHPKNWLQRPKALSGLARCLKDLKWELCEKEGVNELRENINKSVVLVMMILSASGM